MTFNNCMANICCVLLILDFNGLLLFTKQITSFFHSRFMTGCVHYFNHTPSKRCGWHYSYTAFNFPTWLCWIFLHDKISYTFRIVMMRVLYVKSLWDGIKPMTLCFGSECSDHNTTWIPSLWIFILTNTVCYLCNNPDTHAWTVWIEHDK